LARDVLVFPPHMSAREGPTGTLFLLLDRQAPPRVAARASRTASGAA